MTDDRSYTALLDAFVNSGLPSAEFVMLFMEKFKNETESLDTAEFEVLDHLFALCDGFTADEELAATNPDYFVDEPALRIAAVNALKSLARSRRR